MKVKYDPKHFQVRMGETIHLKKWPTLIKAGYQSKEQYKQILDQHVCEAQHSRLSILGLLLPEWVSETREMAPTGV